MFMGRFAQSVFDVRRVLFTGLRDGDVTTPLKWSKELINEVNETRIQGPLGLSSGIYVLMSIEGDLQLIKEIMFP